MFTFSDVSRFVGEKEKYKIVKPVWNVIIDYLLMLLVMLPILFAGMEIAFGSFECVPVVDCPGISKSHTNSSSLFPHNTNRKVCETTVTDLSFIQYAKFVNLECSKKNPIFLSHFSIVLLSEAFLLYVLGNMWLILPTASIIEYFSTLVIECHNFSCPKFELTLALADVRQSIKTELDAMAENNDDKFNILKDTETVRKAKTLYEKMQTLEENLTLSSQKRINIRRIYLIQAILQAILTFAFIVIDIIFMNDLKERISCKITQHIPVTHDYFLCSHGLALAFTKGLWAYIALMLVSFGLFGFTILWTCYIVCKSEYKFNTKELQPHLVGITVLSDIYPVTGDLAFLLHLLHSYNNLFAIRLAPFLSKTNTQKIVAYYLIKKYPVSKLDQQLNSCGNKLTFTKLPGIPQTIFALANQIEELELIECELLKDEAFRNFDKFTGLKMLSIVNCGLKNFPVGILKITQLEVLNLQGNSIRKLNSRISTLPNLRELHLSNNCQIPDHVDYELSNKMVKIVRSRPTITEQNSEEQVGDL